MPQTREHLAILDLLGLARGAVVLTKSDLVSDAAAGRSAGRDRGAASTHRPGRLAGVCGVQPHRRGHGRLGAASAARATSAGARCRRWPVPAGGGPLLFPGRHRHRGHRHRRLGSRGGGRPRAGRAAQAAGAGARPACAEPRVAARPGRPAPGLESGRHRAGEERHRARRLDRGRGGACRHPAHRCPAAPAGGRSTRPRPLDAGAPAPGRVRRGRARGVARGACAGARGQRAGAARIGSRNRRLARRPLHPARPVGDTHAGRGRGAGSFRQRHPAAQAAAPGCPGGAGAGRAGRRAAVAAGAGAAGRRRRRQLLRGLEPAAGTA